MGASTARRWRQRADAKMDAMVAAQDKADQMAETFAQVANGPVKATVYKGFGYVSLTFTFDSLRGRERGVEFHTAMGLPAPKRVRGVEAMWMFS